MFKVPCSYRTEGTTMGASTWEAGVAPDRRMTPDRRVAHSILCQEALARIVAETRGADSHAGRALKELAFRRAAATEIATGDDELIIYSLRGHWIVATVREIRNLMLATASAACRRRSSHPASTVDLGAPAERQPEAGVASRSR